MNKVLCRATSVLASCVLALGVSVATETPTQAAGAPQPAEAKPLPKTVSADALPTVQIDGVVWKQVVVGQTVYAGGEFANARPAGAAPGTQLTPRKNALAYNIESGALSPSWAPAFNGKVSDMAVSPDKSKLFVVGGFTQVDGQTRNRIAVFDLPSGNLSNTVVPNINGMTQSVAATNSTVYVGGYFGAVNNVARARVAAINTSNGALRTGFSVPVDNGMVQGLAVSAELDKLAMSGNFTSVGGSGSPGYGLVIVDGSTGAVLPTPVNSEVRNAGPNSGITNLKSDGTRFYGVGWHYGEGGNSEGTFAANWSDGSLDWLEDCHGDTYDVAPVGGVVYTASHKHYCGNSGGFPQTEPWTMYHSNAFSGDVRGVNTSDIFGYPDHPGTPRPEVLPWFPQWANGTYTSSGQATWTVTGNDDYVIWGGEFVSVNGTRQQGLVRFATRSKAPNKQGPRKTAASINPIAKSVNRGEVRLTWPANFDRDDSKLTYQIQRDVASNKVHETVQDARFWETKDLKWTDSGLVPGSTVRYRVRVLDDSGNAVTSNWVDVAVAATDTLGAYGSAVLDDGASKYWRLDEADSVVRDQAGADHTTAGNGVSRSKAGALIGFSNFASEFNGSASGRVISQQRVDGPNTFSTEVWFKTTTTRGGKIAGFGNAASGTSSSYDRHLFMDASGRVAFGVYPGTERVVKSDAGLNDGNWHQAVATLSTSGMNLYIDGKKSASRADTTSAQSYSGYWRLGGDATWESDQDFNGSIDEFSVYPEALTMAQVNSHWLASGRVTTVPVAAFSSDIDDNSVKFTSTSSDPDGTVAQHAWKFGDGQTSTQASPTHVYNEAGSYKVTLTVTDNDGNESEPVSATIDVAMPNVAPVARFESSVLGLKASFDAAGSSDSDGSVASYSWDFGDESAPGSGVSPDHTYGSAGTYEVTLTVTDNDGKASEPVSATIDVTKANVAPVARFESSVLGLKASFDAAGSSDSDGSVASYSWDFGDESAPGSGVSPGHTYGSAGTYEVSLVVTDDDGVKDVVKHDVTVASMPSTDVLAKDGFTRSQTNGWGTADTGGAWTVQGGASRYAVAGGEGAIKMPAGTSTAVLEGVSTSSVRVDTEFSVDKLAEATYVSLIGRRVGADQYHARLRLQNDGGVRIHLLRGSTAVSSALQVPGLTIEPGQKYRLAIEVTGVSPTTVKGKVWKASEAEPDWQRTGTDSFAALQAPGAVGVFGTLQGAEAAKVPLTLSFDSFVALDPTIETG